MNKVCLIGHLGRDPEMRYTPAGQAVTSFSVATSYRQGDKKETQWFACSAWEKQSELCNQYLQKGSQVYIEGRIKSREYEVDGKIRFSLDVSVSQVQFLGSSQANVSPIGDTETDDAVRV